MAEIVLTNTTDEIHLAEVIEQMMEIGSPVIDVIKTEDPNMYVALEGSHRLQAAEILGLAVEINEVEYSDEPSRDDDTDLTIAETYDGWENMYNNGHFVNVSVF